MSDMTITQADRDLAADWTQSRSVASGIRGGKQDAHAFVRAVASYRTEATRQLEADKAELVEFVRSAAEWTGEGHRTTPWRDIVKSIGNEARELLAKHGGKHD